MAGDVAWTPSSPSASLYLGVYDPGTDQLVHGFLVSTPPGSTEPRSVYASGTVYLDLDPDGGTPIPGCACKVVALEGGAASTSYVPLATWNLYTLTATSYQTEASATSALEGDKLAFSLRKDSTWSDGVTTSESVSGAARGSLQKRPVGSPSWEGLNPPADASGQVGQDVDADFRFLMSGSLVSRPVSVDVIRATDTRSLAPVGVSPSSGASTATATLTTSLATFYDDGVWRPAPVGSPFSVEFRRAGEGPWQQIAASTIDSPGAIAVRVPLVDTGELRVVSGLATSPASPITVTIPASVTTVWHQYASKSRTVVSWARPSGAVKYKIRLSKRNSTKKFSKWKTTTGTRYKFKGLKKKSRYRVQVIALGIAGPSSISTFLLPPRR